MTDQQGPSLQANVNGKALLVAVVAAALYVGAYFGVRSLLGIKPLSQLSRDSIAHQIEPAALGLGGMFVAIAAYILVAWKKNPTRIMLRAAPWFFASLACFTVGWRIATGKWFWN
jgi:hypothetical protein